MEKSARRRSSFALRVLALAGAALAVGACGASSGGSGGVLAIETRGGSIRVDWEPVVGATSYKLYRSTTLPIDPLTVPAITVGAPPHVITGLTGLQHVALSVVGAGGEGPLSAPTSVIVDPPSPERYFPDWADVAPVNVLTFDYDPGRTSSQNGADLMATIAALQPGERLEVGGGTYTTDFAFRIALEGTMSAPIWVVAQAGEQPVITRADALQNALEIGVGGRARYLCLRGFEITGGDIALRLHDCTEVWLDQCHVHDCAQNAVAVNTLPVDSVFLTRNEIHGTSGAGEGIYLGGNNGNPIASRCVIALNHVYDCGGSQGDGIEVKQGSWGNWIAENLVHDTNYPCILVYGTAGRAVNLIERNVCFGSNDNVMQVQGEAIVRNNVAFAGALAFHSGDHQGSTRNLAVVHNTFVNEGVAVNLASWNGRPGMVFANNAAYSRFGAAVQFGSGSSGVQLAGNVAFGPVYGASAGFSGGAGLADFAGASWDGSSRDVTPASASPLLGAADELWAELDQLDGELRVPAFDSGAAERP